MRLGYDCAPIPLLNPIFRTVFWGAAGVLLLSSCNSLIGLDDPKMDSMGGNADSTGGNSGTRTKTSGGTGAIAGSSASSVGGSSALSSTAGDSNAGGKTSSSTTTYAGGATSTTTVGGASAQGGSTATSVTSAVGAASAVGGGLSTGGTIATNVGGGLSTGGTGTGLPLTSATTSAAGGTTATGGTGLIPVGGTVGAGGVATGGAVGAGGVATGGTVGAGGVATGGTVGAGGVATGGAVGAGGVATGGAVGAGGVATGGVAPTGGVVGTGGAPDTVKPTITSFTPTGTSVNPTDILTATFSEAINCSTVTASTFVVQDANTLTSVSGTLACSGATATFTPNPRMTFTASYSAKFTSGITDLAGNALASAPLTKTFVVRDGIWDSTAVALDLTAEGYSPVVSLNNAGDAVVVWGRVNGSYDNLRANRWVASAASWAGPEALQTNTDEAGSSPIVQADGQGNFMAVWREGVAGFTAKYQVYSSRFVSGQGWTAPVQVSKDTANCTTLIDFALQSNGNAVAIWRQQSIFGVTPSVDNSYASRYTAGTDTWTTPTLFATNTLGLSVAVNSSGLAMGLYSTSTSANMLAFTWPSGGSLSASSAIEANPSTDSLGYSGFGTVHVDGSGNFTAIWQRPEGGFNKHWSNQCTAAGSCGTATASTNTDANSSTGAGKATLAVNASGRIMSVWTEWDHTAQTAEIVAGERAAGSTYWPASTTISNATSFPYVAGYLGTVDDDGTRVVNDLKGNAVALWVAHSSGGNSSVWFSRYVPTSGTAWSSAGTLLSGAGEANSPNIAMHPSGLALVVWQETDATGTHVYSKWFR